MKKILSALLVIAMLCSLITLPSMASTDESYVEENVIFYTDFSSPSDIGSLVENTSADIKPEIKTSSDGKSVLSFTRGNTKTGYQYAAFNVVGTSSAPINVEGAPELVVEYMARLASVGTSTYFATTAKLPTVSIRNKNIYYNQYKSDAAFLLQNFSSNDWVKITAVYSNTQETRDIYINDVFIKTLTTADDDNATVSSANPYFKGGCKSFYIPFGFYGSVGHVAELDYVKVYAKTKNFMAKIKDSENASVLGVEVEFNSPVNPSDITKENFTLTDGTNSVTVSNVLKTSENTFKVVPEAPLATGKNYTLNIAINSDIFGTALSTKALTFKTAAGVEFVDGNELYYNTFDSELGFSRYIEVANEIVYGLDTTDDGLSIFRAEGTDVYQSVANYGFVSPKISTDLYNEVVLEYKLRVNADDPHSYMGTWSNLNNGWSKAVDIARGESTKDRLYFHYNDKEPIPGDYTFNPKEWNTVTVVYPADRKSRDIYVNGEFIATSPEGDAENTFASKGFIHFVMLPDFKCSDDLLEVDYYKFTNKTTLFDATLINADSTSAFVKFNTTPSNISKEAFALSDGTAIADIKAIDERTYMLSFEAPLSAGNYTLSFNGIKDTLGRSIDRENLSFVVEDDPSEEIVYANYQFEENAEEEISEFREATTKRYANFTGDYINAADGKLVFTGKGDGAGASYMTVPKYVTEESDLPDFVLEYKMLMTASSNSNYLTDDKLRDVGDSRTIDISKKGIAWVRSDATQTPAKLIMTADELGGIDNWHTIALRYDSTNEVRTLYVDGVEIATSPDTDNKEDNYWTQHPNGKTHMYFTFKHYSHRSATDNIKFEYIKTYSPADKFTASIDNVSNDLKTVYVDFNATVANITPEMIKVGGQQPASIEIFDEAEQIYAINLANKLKSNTAYTLSIMGAKSSLAKECYAVLDFTTRGAEEYTVSVSANMENAGTIEINGVEAMSGNAYEDSDLIVTVKPFINYTATVSVDGKDIFKDRFDNFIIRDVKDDTEVVVTYTEVTDESVVSETIETIPNRFVDEISVYAFGVLRRASDDFGIIVSASKDNLTLDAVNAGNAYKFKANQTNRFGEYGVRLIDVGKKLGAKYYVIPYAVYGETAIYGTSYSVAR